MKPYNSVLGEHFRAHWDVLPTRYAPEDTAEDKQRDSVSLRSGKSGISSMSKSKSTSTTATASTSTSVSTGLTRPGDGDDDLVANLNLTSSGEQPPVRVAYLTEQVSHHPPVSAYFAACPERHIEMLGIDQISAKVSGTAIRVSPGEFNRGIFIRLTGGPGEGDRYRITHPVASVNGILRGNFYVTVGDSVIITCEEGRNVGGHEDGSEEGEFKGKARFRAIIEYKEESWLGRAHFLLEGVVHLVYESDGERCEEWTKVKHVPKERVVACFEGSWRGGIKWRRVGAGSYAFRENGRMRSTASSPAPSHVKLPVPPMALTSYSRTEFAFGYGSSSAGGIGTGEPWLPLLDVSTLSIIPKVVRPLDRQHPRESRKLWENVTDKLVKKEYSEATKEKMQIEQRQRDEAAERKKIGIEWVFPRFLESVFTCANCSGCRFIPRYFEKSYDTGWAELTEEGKFAIKEELKEESGFCVEGSGVNVDLAD